ncbi:MAG: hypothetical protein K4H23_05080 [Mollicutes bacterium PWAP]|nr:hypothetical protein [Mollicutes bacterium PWAP]
MINKTQKTQISNSNDVEIKQKMFSKNYWKELLKKQTVFEWIWQSIFLTVMLFFSILDINGGLVLNSSLKSGRFLPTFGQILIIFGALAASLIVMNRLHRFKQELPFLLLGTILTGLGLLMQGYDSSLQGGDMGGLMSPGMIQIFIFGMSSLAGLAKVINNKSNVSKLNSKIFSIEMLVSILSILIVIGPFYMIFDRFAASSTTSLTNNMNWIEWIGIIGFAFSTSAIIIMTIWRWQWTLVLWTISNILFITYYLILYIDLGYPVLALVLICSLYFFVDLYILGKWIILKSKEFIS